MNVLINRLRESKVAYEQLLFHSGQECGRAWAKETADV